MFLQVLVWTSVWSLIISKGITGLGVQWFLLGLLLPEKLIVKHFWCGVELKYKL
jgi:hypothetical protein